jgi:hypothetical protein
VSQTNISQFLVHSEDRRRFPRHRAFAITYLDLGDDNGGILLNLGGGGLSFQAVAKLNPGQDVALRFGLFTDRETITVTGKVIWLGPTRKEAGVCFAELSDNAEQIIAKWLAAQDAERISAERSAASFGDSEPAPNEIHLLPPQFPAASAASTSTLSDLDTQRAPSVAPPGGAHLSDSFLDHTLNRAKTSPVFGTYVPPLMPSRLLSYPKEQPKPAAPPANVHEESLGAQQPTIRFLRTIPAQNDVPSVAQTRTDQVQVLRAASDPQMQFTSSPAISSPSVAPVDKVMLRALPMLVVLQKNRRVIQVTAGVAACIGIFVLLLTMASLDRRSVDDSSSAAVAGAPNIPVPAPGAVNSEPSVDTTAGVKVKSGVMQNSSQPKSGAESGASTGLAGSFRPPPSAPATESQIVEQKDSSWFAALKETLFGVEDKSKLDPIVAAVPVWTDQRTGFYYCSDSRYFAKPERVSLLTQGEALQSGFQPKLGIYCY